MAAAACGPGAPTTPTPKAASAATPSAPASASGPASPPPIAVTVKDFSIAMERSTVESGFETFVITNKGPSIHEFVLFLTDLAADKLPVENGQVNEESTGLELEGDAEDIQPGPITSILTANLPPGHYAVICNVRGHYLAGMHTDLTVTG
jgi:uncharacterized cupredoxin-like copper-binding protein